MSARGHNPWAPGANYKGAARAWMEGLREDAIGVIDERHLTFVGAADPAAPDRPVEATMPEGASPTDLRVLGSYSWTIPGRDEAKILVPGSPPLWRNSSLPLVVPSDEDVYRSRAEAQASAAGAADEPDAAAASLPDTAASPYLYLLAHIAAVSLATPAFHWPSADLVVGRDSLLCMYRWAHDAEQPDFRIDLHRAGARTVVMTRWIPKRVQKATPGSFGVSYERHETAPAPGCESGRWGGHYRVLSYNFGGLHMVVNSKAGARLQSPVDALADSLAHTSIEQGTDAVAYLGELAYRRVGALTAQSDVVELVTKSKAWVKNYKRRRAYPVLALGGIRHHILALHANGEFVEVRHEQLGTTPSFVAAATATALEFGRLRCLLGTLQALVMRTGERISVLCRDKKLEVFTRIEGGTELPAEFRAKFA